MIEVIKSFWYIPTSCSHFFLFFFVDVFVKQYSVLNNPKYFFYNIKFTSIKYKKNLNEKDIQIQRN